MKKGFTLLELLVVIAILGILSAVVLSTLSSSKAKGNDATTKAQLSKLRDIIGDYGLTNNGSFVSACTNPLVGQALTQVLKSSGAATIEVNLVGASNRISCHESSSGWALAAPLREGGYWCVDHTGASSKETVVLALGSMICP